MFLTKLYVYLVKNFILVAEEDYKNILATSLRKELPNDLFLTS